MYKWIDEGLFDCRELHHSKVATGRREHLPDGNVSPFGNNPANQMSGWIASNRLEHDKNLDILMDRCRQIGLKLNADKTEVGQTEIPFFGHVLTENGLKIDPSKVRAIQEMPSPQSKSDLETILGMINYLQRFAPNLPEMTSPLRQLLKKDSIFRWDPEHETALNKIKGVITQNPGQILSYFDPKVDVVLQVDASQNELGCVLLQNENLFALPQKH